MALLDLSLVTRSLVRLVFEAIDQSPAKPPGTVSVTSLSPDRLAGDQVVGLYLYHVVEQAASKNQVWANRPMQPNKYSPLGLDLHYVLCAKSDLPEEQGPYREQLLMGLALKALHDYPIVDDGTMIGAATILEPSLIGEENRLRLALRHVPPNDAISYWTAGSQAARLCAYYEVSVILLDPEEPEHGGGRVLAYNIDVFAGGLPRLSASRSTVTFTLPAESTPRTVDVQPATAAIGGEITFIGGGLSGAIALRARGAGWASARDVGPAWGVNGGGDRVYATVAADIDGDPALPGTYAASVTVTRDGKTLVSNETPFVIAPGITSIGPVVNGVFTIGGGLFADPRSPAVVDVHVRAAVGGIQLARVQGAPQPGEFRVVSATELEVCLPMGAAGPLPIRIEVEGAESAPAWVTP